MVAELGQIFGRAVGQGAVSPVPDILGRVELGRIGGKVVDVEPRVGREEVPHFPPSVDGTAIPE